MKRITKYLLAAFVFILGIHGFSTNVRADGERVFFGSEQYEWSLGQEAPIGVYAGADEEINTIEVEVQYDPEMLEYSSGGELTEPGTVKIYAGDLAVWEYQEMLNFIPRVSGNTEIVIRQAKIADAGGETQITEEIKAPVHIPFAAGCELTGLSVNGQPVPGFESAVTEYSIELEGENAEVQATASDPQTAIEITGTDLTDTENVIRVFTANAAGETGLYTIHVTKKETPAEATDSQQVQDSSDRMDQEQEIQQTAEKNSFRDKIVVILTSHKKTVAVLAAALLVLILWLIVFLMMKRSRRKKALQRRYEKQKECYELDPVYAQPEIETDLTGVEEELPVLDEREMEIQVKHVSIEFSKEKDESTSLKELLVKTLKGQRKVEKFKALDDVSFNVKKGEVVGIIGTNGSGKSTILKIISGVLNPTEGEVIVDRDKIQLLTLGTGFDFELTGRENVYLNGAVIGYTKEFIDEKYDEIVKFAELEGFMEQKVRNYSSGMVSRLGFAIATVRDTPEILILDEVLSVGDMFFRKKSEKRIKEMMRSGSTVLIVSHSTSVIKANCTKAVWIEKGKLMAVGRPDDVCRAYEKMNG